MIRFITVSFLLLLSSFSLTAQTVRTDVTVIGSNTAAISAGIQAARSGVKTLIINERKAVSAVFSPDDLVSLQGIRDHYLSKEVDTAKKSQVKTQNIRPEEAAKVLKSISDTVKNLTIMLNVGIREINKERKGWQIKLTDGRTIKTDLIVAQDNPKTPGLLKLDPNKTVIQLNNWLNTPASMPKIYRTSFGWGTLQNKAGNLQYLLPAGIFIPLGIETVFMIPKNPTGTETMLAGQAAGASAAFCAFFKTTSKNLNVRVTQGELLAYGSELIPYTDVSVNDRHHTALQHIGLTGILKAKTISPGRSDFIFDSLGTISSKELRLPMKEYYSRSQIWFADHVKDSLTVEDAVNLLMFTATRGEELRKEIEAGWQSSFLFSGKYDPKKVINRREFAVLTDRYLMPFNVKVDLGGNLLN